METIATKRSAGLNAHQGGRPEGMVALHHVRATAKFGEIKLLDALQPVQKSYKFRLFD
jgi:hypothetical protein